MNLSLIYRLALSAVLALSLFCAGLGGASPLPATAQTGQPGLPMPAEAVKLDTSDVIAAPAMQARGTIPGLQYNLEQIYRAAQSKDSAMLETFSGMQFVDIENAQARVILEMETSSGAKQSGEAWVETVTGGDGSPVQIYHPAPVSVRLDLEMALKLSGAKLETATDGYVQVLAPFTSLEALTRMPGVRLVRLPYPSTQTIGAYTSQGVNLTHSNTWQSAGIDGEGVIVGVYDFGFTGWAGLQTSGDLPPGARLVAKDYSATYSFNPDTAGMKHGAACAEVVYDMAPGSTIYMYAFNTEVELGNAIADFMAVDGKRVASMSIGWVNAGPYDGTGYIGDLITAAKNDGILWFTSMGNNQAQHWSGTSTQYSTGDTIAFGTGNLNWIGPETGYIWVVSPGTEISLYLEWNDWNTARTNNQNHIDYDLVLFNHNGSTWVQVADSAQDQCGSTYPPIESIEYTVPAGSSGYYALLIARYTGGGSCPNNFGHWMNLHTFNGFFTPGEGAENTFVVNNHCNSVMIPADSDSNVSVGAIYWGEDGTASLYGLETFSSLGPRSAAGGANPGTTVNKPDIVAPDGVNNVSYGANAANYANGGSGFWGTSAAAPHAAGLAATVWEDYPSFTNTDLRTYINGHALYKANGGSCGGAKCETVEGAVITSATQNNRFGWGRIDLNNTAPVLNNTGTMSLTGIDEDNLANGGTLVSAIISSAGGDRITDSDAASVEGIAVTAVDGANGSWEYTLDGTTWLPMGVPTGSAARLLPSDATARIRFLPNANWNGTVASGLTFRAWDQTRTDAGTTADTTTNGGVTPFSTNTETASIVVNPINDAPVLAAIGNMPVVRGSTLTFTASATDVEGHILTYTLDVGGPASDGIIGASGVYTWATTPGDTLGDYTVTVRVTDNGTPNLNDFETITITLVAATDSQYLPMITR